MPTDGEERKLCIAAAGEARLEEKKSVFIAYVHPAANEDEAHRIIKKKKAEYSDATHNVWAYYLGEGAHARCSDDGEPQGTAGVPVLNALKMFGATDVCAVITRYFGGTLLGAGGLVRAYSAAVRAALDAAGLAERRPFSVYRITVAYQEYGRLSVQLPKLGAVLSDIDFGGEVSFICAADSSVEADALSLIREATAGRAKCEKLRDELRALKI